MVKNDKEHRKKKPARQAFQETRSEPNKIGASTPYQFSGKNLTAYGGLLPVATMLEKLGFQALEIHPETGVSGWISSGHRRRKVERPRHDQGNYDTQRTQRGRVGEKVAA